MTRWEAKLIQRSKPSRFVRHFSRAAETLDAELILAAQRALDLQIDLESVRTVAEFREVCRKHCIDYPWSGREERVGLSDDSPMTNTTLLPGRDCEIRYEHWREFRVRNLFDRLTRRAVASAIVPALNQVYDHCDCHLWRLGNAIGELENDVSVQHKEAN